MGSSLSVRLGYVGSYGYNMIRTADANLVTPTILPDGRKFFPEDGEQINPNFSDIERIHSNAEYNYNSLQMVVQKSLSAGLRLGAAYTWSKTMSNADVITGSQIASTTDGAQDMENLAAEYSISAYDQRHTLVWNGRYDMPWERALTGGVAKAVLGGWSVNWIYSYGSGLPFNINTSFLNSRSGSSDENDRPNLRPGFSNNPIHGTTAGCQGIQAGQKLRTPERWYDPCAFELPDAGFFGNLGRNTVTLPNVNQVDFTIVKNTALTESKSLEFRAEFFNLFNRTHFGTPNQQVFNPSRAHAGNEGRITTTSSSNREIQLGLKLIF